MNSLGLAYQVVCDFIEREIERIESGQNPTSEGYFKKYTENFILATKIVDVPFQDYFDNIVSCYKVGNIDAAYEILENCLSLLEDAIETESDNE